MNIVEICDVVAALQKAKAEINNINEKKEDDAFLTMLDLLSKECREFCELYEKENPNCQKLEGIEW